MRRTAVSLLVFLFCVLCAGGCAPKQQVPQPMAADFLCEFRANYRELTVAGTLTRYTAGTLLLAFSQPETLSGLTAEWNGETVKLSFLGLEYTVSPEVVPEAALGKELTAVLDAALRGEGERKQEGAAVTVTGMVGEHTYTYVYDSQTGAPQSLVIPSLPLSMTFSDCTAKTGG